MKKTELGVGRTVIGLVLCIILAPVVSLAHGENKKGPHGGFIRMPGAFHTEVKELSPRKFAVYLLDMEWKGPTTKDSQVTAQVKNNGKSIDLSCEPVRDRFECSLPKGVRLKAGDELNIKATRSGASGGLAVYPYPFKLVDADTTHSNH